MATRITVLMPVYNAESFLDEAIESILQQDFDDYEFLIIDDGSTDNSLEIVRSYTDKRIRVVHHPQNMGLVATLNQGIALSSGPFIARMDADDVSLPHRLRLRRDFLQRHQMIAMCGGAVNVMGSTQIWRQPSHPEEVKCHLLFRCCFAHPTVMIRREVLTVNCRYNPDFPHAEDYDLWVRLSDSQALANLEVPLIKYRLHEHQVSRVHSVAQRTGVHQIHRRLLNALGIAPTDVELNLHADAPQYRGTTELRQWLDRIRFANLEKRIYNPTVLDRVLASIEGSADAPQE